MIWYFRPRCESIANFTAQAYRITFIQPMRSKLFHRIICLNICMITSFHVTSQFKATVFPMSLSPLICELAFTSIAIELMIVESLFNKAVQLWIQIERSATIRTRIISFSPRGDTVSAAKLVAREAFLGLFNHHKANCAGKVGIQYTHGLLRYQFLIIVDFGF